nr:hypothetical protein [Tanacetum cinerariifolium]
MRGYSIGVEALVDIRQVIKVDAELESRFWFCMSNTAYLKYGYGVLQVYGGYGVSIFMDTTYPCPQFLVSLVLVVKTKP